MKKEKRVVDYRWYIFTLSYSNYWDGVYCDIEKQWEKPYGKIIWLAYSDYKEYNRWDDITVLSELSAYSDIDFDVLISEYTNYLAFIKE